MNTKPGDFGVYTNVGGTKETLEAVDNTKGKACQGCVGEDTPEVCGKLGMCSQGYTCIIWREIV